MKNRIVTARTVTRVAIVAAAVTLPLCQGAVSFAASNAYVPLTDAQISALTMQIHQTFAQLHAENATGAQIDAAVAKQYGLQPGVEVGTASRAQPDATAASSASQVSVAKPTYYWDNAHHEGFVDASWQWTAAGVTAVAGEVGCTSPNATCAKNVGGVDAFGVAVNRPLSPSEYDLSTYNEANTYQGAVPLADSTPLGAGFEGQDKFGGNSANPGYSWYRGDATLAFKGFGGCGGTIQMFSKLSHTWSSTSVNSIGLSADSVSIGWSTQGNAWNAASQPSAVYKTIGC